MFEKMNTLKNTFIYDTLMGEYITIVSLRLYGVMLELVQFTSTHLCGNWQYYRMKNAATGITIYSLLCLLPCAVNNEQVPMRL